MRTREQFCEQNCDFDTYLPMHIFLDILQKDLPDDTTALELAGKQVDNPFTDKSSSRNEQFDKRLCSDI